MSSLAERILAAIRFEPLDDDVLARRLDVPHRQAVNQVARRLEAQGRLRRLPGPNGKIVNALVDGPTNDLSIVSPPPARPAAASANRIVEDDVKEAVRAYLVSRGFQVTVAWGRTRGIDIDARHADGRRYVIEAKGEVGQSGPQQVNYFLGALGELVQRMDDPHARYGIALPRNRQYGGLIDRLPTLAKDRLRLDVFWVVRDDGQLKVEVADP